MAARLNVKLGISLSLIAIMIWLPFKKEGNQSSGLSKKAKIKESLLTKKSNSHKKSSKVNISAPCLEIKHNLEKLVKQQKPTLHWKNHYLQRDGIEYNLRVERDYNLQGFEVKKAKLFKLDSDGFPELITESILQSQDHLKQLMQGYSYITDNSVISYEQESILVVKEENQIVKATNLAEDRECHFISQL